MSPSKHVSSAIDNYYTFLKTSKNNREPLEQHGHNTEMTNKLDKQKI